MSSILDIIFEKESNRLKNTEGGQVQIEQLEEEISKIRTSDLTAKEPEESDYSLFVQTPEALEALIKDFSSAKLLTLDVETTGIDPFKDGLVGIGLGANNVYKYIPVGHNVSGGQLPPAMVVEKLKPLLEAKEIIAHNGQFECMFFKRLGIDLHIAFDTMIACQLADELRPCNLKDAARIYLGVADWSLDLKKTPANKRSIREVGKYCKNDCLYTYRLYETLEPLMRDGFYFVFYKVEMPLVPIVASVVLSGIPVDQEYLHDVAGKVAERRGELTKDIHAYAGREFNINSNSQLATVLFDELKLPVVEKTDAGRPSTSAEALEKMGPDAHPIIRKLLDYRGYEKIKSSYLRPDIKPETGRVHPQYRQIGTETGRMTGPGSGFHPLTFPKDGVHPFSLRKAIGDVPGMSIVCADYASQEPRITGSYSGDEKYKAPFAVGESSHGHVAKLMFGIEGAPNNIKKKSPEQYSIAKIINLGLVYGMSEYALSRRLNEAVQRQQPFSPEEAQGYIEKFFAKFPAIKTWLDSVKKDARKHGFVVDMVGRRRRLPILKEKCRKGDKELFKQQMSAEREATNFMVQGLAASQTKRAMVRCHNALKIISPKTEIIAARHDELMFLVPNEDLDKVCATIKKEMETDPELTELGLSVKPEVEITYGPNWSSDAQRPWIPSGK